MGKKDIDLIIRKDFFIKSRKQNIKDYFNFVCILGKGAYGTVYKARQKQYPNTQRAVKVLTKKSIKNQQALLDEVNILKQSDYPSIVKIYQTFQDENYLCLVLDYCQGGELFGRLQQQGSFSQKQARQLFKQMVETIKYLHSNKICHRDLKPENFLMSYKQTLDIKFADFGLSARWQNDLKKQLIDTGKNKIVGTSYYIAPEVLNKSYDQKCDIWSLGVILYILVTATPPFDGDDDNQILKSVQKLEYSLEIPEMKKISSELKDLIKKILVPADKRISVDQILQHPWMTGATTNQQPLKLDFGKIRAFSNFSRFKTVMAAYIASQIPQKNIHALGKAFRQMDKNSDGYLTIQQISQVLQSQKQIMSTQQLSQILTHVDTDKNGKINYNQFVASCLQASYFNNQKYLRYVFNSIDVNNDGKITYQQFQYTLTSCGISQFRNKAIDQILKDVDANQDGKIDYLEFLIGMGKMQQNL